MDGAWRWWRRPTMMWLVVLGVAAVVGGAAGGGVDSRVRLVQNGYEGLVVGLSQALDEEDGAALVEAVTKVFDEASRRLYRATNRRAYFRDVTILVPRDWTSVNTTSQAGSESFEGSDIRVDSPNPVYRHQPYTEQSGGCGDPGRYIHLTPEYLLDDDQAAWYGPRGKALLLEWAKYRWGVFDELGYPGDPQFPLFYSTERGRVSPTHCANQQIRGRQIDKNGRSSCTLTRFGLPDDHCRFVPYRDQRATSSLLSYPIIRSDELVHFCGGVEEEHDTEAPTKQNAYCDKKSAWEVIGQHHDFRSGNNPPADSYQSPSIRIVQQSDANFALVLDYSGSMNDHYRVHKLRRTARRWLLHEVAEGSHVAIINFSKKAKLVHKITRITDEASRKALADSIQTQADGGTSIGAGLSVAAGTVLKGRSNPVIVLITDGAENENPRIDDVINVLESSKARVITVAFGADADPKLERVAEVTGGKTFTVNDIDEGQMLEDAFHGALTYQPPPPPSRQTVTIHNKEYRVTGLTVTDTFIVDRTVGRNLTLWLETGAKSNQSSPSLRNPKVTPAPELMGPDGSRYTNAAFDPDSSTWTLVVPMAEVGRWTWAVGLSGERESFVRARVTSQPRNPNVLPITTRAWVSSGAKEVNASVDKVVIFAEVKQGNNPVVKADVRALVTPPTESDPAEEYTLLDNGQGADRLAGDGIYSRYMTSYPSVGRFSVKAQVTNGGKALINKGFLTSPQKRRRRRREAKEEEEEENLDDDYVHVPLDVPPDYCCGSVVPLSPDSIPTGSFNRTSIGGSINVISVPKKDAFPPARVRDLQVELQSVGWAKNTLPTHASVTLSFTAPGDDLDKGVVSEYDLRMSSNKTDFTEENFRTNASSSNSSSSTWRRVDLSGYPVKVEGGTELSLNLSLTLTTPTTYFALRALDDVGLASEVSNIASLVVEVSPRSSPEVLGVKAYVVVVGVVVALCTLVVVLMLCLAHRRRTTASQKFV